MAYEERDTLHLIRIASIDEREQRRSPATLQRSTSLISYENVNLPPTHIFGVLNEIYADRAHRTCIRITYLTLLSMILAITLWMSYWLASNRCENVTDDELRLFLCDLVDVLEMLTFVSLGISPVLFVIMILFWIRYSCHNPMDPIREDGKLFKIEGDQWKEQLKYFYTTRKFRFSNCCHCRQRKELDERGYGYVILSSHGIVVDELILLSAQRNIIDHGVLSDNNKLLKLTFKRAWLRPWRIRVFSIYLPGDLNHRADAEELLELLKIRNDGLSTAAPASL